MSQGSLSEFLNDPIVRVLLGDEEFAELHAEAIAAAVEVAPR